MGSIIRTASHEQIQADTAAGPADYTQGGMTIQTALGRVDEAMIEAKDETYMATVTEVTGNNNLNVVVVDVSDGSEVAADTDLTGTDFTFLAVRK